MRRQSLVRTAACLALLFAVVIGSLVWMLRREPEAYRSIPVPEGAERRRLAGEFSSHIQQLVDRVGQQSDEHWSETFTADQLNSYFEEDFVRVKPFQLPEGVHAPRVAFRPGRVQLAFRYGHGFWSSVIIVDLNIWLVANEANVLAVELLGLHAGAVPVSMQSLQDQLAEAVRSWGLDVTWYRHNGNAVALVRHQPDRPNPAVVLQRLELQDGKLLIEGRSTEPTPIRAMLSMNDPTQGASAGR